MRNAMYPVEPTWLWAETNIICQNSSTPYPREQWHPNWLAPQAMQAPRPVEGINATLFDNLCYSNQWCHHPISLWRKLSVQHFSTAFVIILPTRECWQSGDVSKWSRPSHNLYASCRSRLQIIVYSKYMLFQTSQRIRKIDDTRWIARLLCTYQSVQFSKIQTSTKSLIAIRISATLQLTSATQFNHPERISMASDKS